MAYQRALDLDLDNLLSQWSDLDKQLSNLHNSSQVLEIVEADSDRMLFNVTSTCDLADQVSAKVRKLDHPITCQIPLFRLDDTVEHSNCIDGVK